MKWVLLNMKDNRGIVHGMGTKEAKGDRIKRIKGKVRLGKRKDFLPD